MSRLLLVAASLALGACTTLDYAGHAAYSVRPITDSSGRTSCCEVIIKDGKQFKDREVVVDKKGADFKVTIREGASQAFVGQGIAAEAAKVFSNTVTVPDAK